MGHPPEDIQKTFRMNLEYFRRERGLTQQELAERCGYEAYFIEEIEQGDVDPSMETVNRLSKVLNINPYRLVFGIQVREEESRVSESVDQQSVSTRAGEDPEGGSEESGEPRRNEQNRAQLQDLRERYRELFQAAPFGFISLDSDGVITQVNPLFKKMLEYEDRGVIGDHINRYIVSEDEALFRDHRDRLWKGEEARLSELRFRSGEGDVLVGSIDMMFLEEPGESPRIALALKEVTPLVEVHDRMQLEQEDELETARDANPLTGLPGNVTVQNQIESYLEDDVTFALIYVDLDNFKSFNDRYGFERGDKVLLLLRDILRKGLDVFEARQNFLGHIGGDDFVILTSPENAEGFCEWVINKFDNQIPGLYDEADREQGGITTLNRQGNREFFSIMTLSLAVVRNDTRSFDNYLEMTEAAAEVKEYVKQNREESLYHLDQRTDPE